MAKGYTFVPSRKGNVVNTLVDLNCYTRKLNLRVWFNSSGELHNECTEELKKPSVFNPPLNNVVGLFEKMCVKDIRYFYGDSVRSNELVKSVKNLNKEEEELLGRVINNKDVRFMKPDKGNGVVVMNKGDYLNGMNALLLDGTYEEISLNEVKVAHHKIDLLLSDMLFQEQINDSEYFYMLNEHPMVSNIFGIQKIHKGLKNPKFRPIADGKRSKTCFISKYLDNKLQRSLEKFTYISKDLWQFLEKLKAIEVTPDIILVTVDVTNLFSVIPHEIGLLWVEQQLNKTHIFDQDQINKFITLMEVVLKTNYIF